jgi:hypothetical protein
MPLFCQGIISLSFFLQPKCLSGLLVRFCKEAANKNIKAKIIL